jgi:hypothetical protein
MQVTLFLIFTADDLTIIISLFAALVLLSVSDSGAFAKVLNIGPLIWLDEISYSLYLLHGFVQFSACRGLGAIGIHHTAALSSGRSLALMMLMLAMCVFGASATYWGIEKRLAPASTNPAGWRTKDQIRSCSPLGAGATNRACSGVSCVTDELPGSITRSTPAPPPAARLISLVSNKVARSWVFAPAINQLVRAANCRRRNPRAQKLSRVPAATECRGAARARGCFPPCRA